MFLSKPHLTVNFLFSQTAETVEAIVTQLMEKQRLARQATLTKQLECGCPDSTCADGKACSHPMRRITANVKQERQIDNNNQVPVIFWTKYCCVRAEAHRVPIIFKGSRTFQRLQPFERPEGTYVR